VTAEQWWKGLALTAATAYWAYSFWYFRWTRWAVLVQVALSALSVVAFVAWPVPVAQAAGSPAILVMAASTTTTW
jgi:hypothetical protein